jgi:hypothetical protein
MHVSIQAKNPMERGEQWGELRGIIGPLLPGMEEAGQRGVGYDD